MAHDEHGCLEVPGPLQRLNIRRWLDGNPGDELAGQMREELATSPARYARYQREYLGWGVFAP